MHRRLVDLLLVALQTLRANPLHILLSTLGLVIGVAALVAILSLGDGLEAYGRDQISTTTTLESIVATPLTRDWIDGVSVARDTIATVDLDDVIALGSAISDSADIVLTRRANVVVALAGSAERTGAYFEAVAPVSVTKTPPEMVAGRFVDTENVRSGEPELVLSAALATQLAHSDSIEALVGRIVAVDTIRARVVGIMAGGQEPRAIGSYREWTERLAKVGPPELLVRVHDVENVPAVRDRVEGWLDATVEGGSEAFAIVTNRQRVAQVMQGVKLFKIIMGLITGIAVLVGGIGVMNVLLISVTERTREIGIRKAAGARRSDVVTQFLAESVVISVTGSLLGLLLGLAVVAVALPIVKQITAAPFEVAFSWGSLRVVALVALAVGVAFGTYPAWRASRLSPVDAMRHE